MQFVCMYDHLYLVRTMLLTMLREQKTVTNPAVLLTVLMEQQTVSNPAAMHGLCAMTKH